jgi:UDP-glucose 4-epimerase
MNILVTGCAGFIGSVVTERLLEKGHTVVGVDDLRESYPENIPEGVITCYKHALWNWGVLDYIFQHHKIDCVIHLAASSIIGRANTNPEEFFSNNVMEGQVLLQCMKTAGVKNIIYSSTASVYGEPQYLPMDENHPVKPINAYGESKYMLERILYWYRKSYGFNTTIFRYYNVGGSTLKHGENRKTETRLIPEILRCAKNEGTLSIFGNDYETKDGTCARDYLHVSDVADAHILALDKMENEIYNLGSGNGYTVLEILHAMEKVMDKEVHYKYINRREGDPVTLVCSNKKAIEKLGWNPVNSTLEQICSDSYRWSNR